LIVCLFQAGDNSQQPSTNKRARMMAPQATAPGTTALPCTVAADYQVLFRCLVICSVMLFVRNAADSVASESRSLKMVSADVFV